MQAPLLFYRVRGNISLSAYRANCRYDRIVTRNHARHLVGRAGTYRALTSSWLKEALAVGLYASGAEDRFQNRRVAPIEDAELTAANDVLREITQIHVPGWDAKASHDTHERSN
jgi:hypothetical protein